MISLPVHDSTGQAVGTYEFDPSDLAPGVNKQLLHDAVVMYEANRRVGTATTKSRARVKGTTAKMYRQKGTGRARAGSRRSPVRRGGGHTFAKSKRDFSYRLPKKAVKLATRMALLSKFTDDQAFLLDELTLDAPKTKDVVSILKALRLDNDSCLLAVDRPDENVWRSVRNIASVRMAPAAELNAYDLLCQRNLLLTKAALDRLRGVSNDAGSAEG